MPNYKRGLSRVYIVVAVAWIAWGLYRPVANWKRSIVRFHELEVEETALCKQQNETYQQLEAAGSPPSGGMIDCEWSRRNSVQLASILEHKSIYDVYRDAGGIKTAAFCLLPPISLYVLILAIVSIVLWIGRGFNGSARWQVVRTRGGRGADIQVPPRLPPAQ